MERNENMVDTGIKESTLWTIRVPQIMRKLCGWATLKCYEVSKKKHEEMKRENDSTSGLKTKDEKIKTAIFMCTFICAYKDLK